MVINNVLRSAGLLADASRNMREFLVAGTELNMRPITSNLDRSVIVITALSPNIRYERAAAIARYAMVTTTSHTTQ